MKSLRTQILQLKECSEIEQVAEERFEQFSVWIKNCLKKNGSFKDKQSEIRYWLLYGRMSELAEILGKTWI